MDVFLRDSARSRGKVVSGGQDNLVEVLPSTENEKAGVSHTGDNKRQLLGQPQNRNDYHAEPHLVLEWERMWCSVTAELNEAGVELL